MRVSESGPSDPTHGSGPSSISLDPTSMLMAHLLHTEWESRIPALCALTLSLTLKDLAVLSPHGRDIHLHARASRSRRLSGLEAAFPTESEVGEAQIWTAATAAAAMLATKAASALFINEVSRKQTDRRVSGLTSRRGSGESRKPDRRGTVGGAGRLETDGRGMALSWCRAAG